MMTPYIHIIYQIAGCDFQIFFRIKKWQEFVGIISTALAWGQLYKTNGDSIVMLSRDCKTRIVPNKRLINRGLTDGWDFF
jgi:hypothetical protein